MKRTKRWLSLLMVLCLCFTTVPLPIEASASSFDPIWPCQSAYRVSCLYYYKDGSRHSCKYDYTKGMDIAGGGNIVAVEAGKVVTATYDTSSGFGNYVIIEHDNGSRSVYAHLASYTVSAGNRVSKGQVIGVMGNTSAKYNIGVHLHFEYQGADPWKTYYKSKYAQNITYDSNVRTNNNSYNSDKTIVNWIDSYYTYSGGVYRYKGGLTEKPANPWITASASAVVAGSGTVTINCGADHATNYTVGIDRLGTGRVVTQELSGPTYTTSFNQGGIYRIYVTCYNSAGYADTSAVFVTVYHDLGTDFTAPILNKGHWKPIENAYNSGYKVQLATETGFANQLWYFERQSDGSYKISSCYDGRCLDVKDASNQPDTTVQTHPSNDNAAQRWYIWEEAGGYVLKPKCSSCVLDLTDNKSADGTNIITYTYHGGAPQIWSIYRGEECILKSPSMTVSPGDSKSATTFTWGNVYGARNYNVKIWKGTAWDGEQFAGANNVTSGYRVVLPAGTYQAYVDAVHQFGCKMSNLVTFTVKEHTHSNTYKVTKSPTTSAAGTLTGTCSKCSGTTTVTLPKLNTSDYSYAVIKAATCTATGTGRYTWKTTTYGSFYFDVSIAATNHSYSYKATKSPTTSATGTLTGTCSKCSGTTTVTLPKLNSSDYSIAVLREPTCTEEGAGRYTWKTPLTAISISILPLPPLAIASYLCSLSAARNKVTRSISVRSANIATEINTPTLLDMI